MSTRIVRTGVPQGSKLSLVLFNYYIADMSRPTPPVTRVSYADDVTVWTTGPKSPHLESIINSYMREVNIYPKDNSLLICVPKSTVTLEDTQLLLERSPKILGVIMDPSLSFRKHCNYVSDRIDKRNNMLRLQTTQPISGGAVTADSSCCTNCVEPPRPSNGCPIYIFLGMPATRTRWMTGAAAHKSGWMLRPIQVRQLLTRKSGFVISAINKYMPESRYP